MRKLSIIMMLLFCAGFTYAQKGKVTQAVSYFTSGKLDQAKKLIDEAITHENCVAWDKAYFTKGQIYQAIFESQNKDYKKLDPNALNVAWDAYQKVAELDVKQKFNKQLETQYKNMIIDFTNKAVEYYNAGDFKNAVSAFKKVLEIENNPIILAGGPAKVDTAIIFNTAVAAQKGGDFAEAEKWYKETLKYNYETARIYPLLCGMLKEQGKTEEALKYLHKGFELFPDNSDMLVELINYYLHSDTPEKAESYLDAAIKQDPKNASYYQAKGMLYEKTNQPQKAMEIYQTALQVDPKNFIAQFNIGTLKLSEVIEHQKKLQDIVDIDQYNKAADKVMEEYMSVIPYFEKAHEIRPEDKGTLQALKELYFKMRTKNPDYQKKYDEMKAKLDQLQ